jgi:4-hydroxybenzoate polyprenyltransferase
MTHGPDESELLALGVSPGSVSESRVSVLPAVVRAMRPAQWTKNGVVFAGLLFGGKLLDGPAIANAVFAAVCFCVLSSGFYVLNDVRDVTADRLHPLKRLRPVASGELEPLPAIGLGLALVVAALAASSFLGAGFLIVVLGYAGLMAAYNLWLKQIVILDVFAIAGGFVLRAVGGAVAVDVSISPWLLICTMLLALLIGFGKRRSELVGLEHASRHRHNLDAYSQPMLDQFVAVSAAGTLLAYAIYTFDSVSVPFDHRMMLTVPIVAYAVFRYLHLVYQRGQGGAPETMLLSDRGLIGSVALWGLLCAAIFYGDR